MVHWFFLCFVLLFPIIISATHLSPGQQQMHENILERKNQLQQNQQNTVYTRMGIGLILNNMGNIDLRTGFTLADLNLFFRQDVRKSYTFNDYQNMKDKLFCDDYVAADNVRPSPNTLQKLDLVNLASVHMRVDVIRDMTTNLIDHWRLRGRFFSVTELKNWPYEYQRLEIVLDDIMDFVTSDNNQTVFFCFMSAYSGVSTDVRFPGEVDEIRLEPDFHIYDICQAPFLFPFNKLNGACRDRYNCKLPCVTDVSQYNIYPNNTDVSCRCKVGATLTNRLRFTVLYLIDFSLVFVRLYLPALFIVMVNQATYFIPPRNWNARFAVCGSTLLSSVTYHVNLIGRTPDTSIFTRADFFMLCVFISHVLSWLVTVVLMVLETSGYNKMAIVMFSWSRHMSIYVLLAIFSVPFIEHLTEDIAVISLGSVVAILFFLVAGMLSKLLFHFFFTKLCTPMVRARTRAIIESLAQKWRGKEDHEHLQLNNKKQPIEMKEPLLNNSNTGPVIEE